MDKKTVGQTIAALQPGAFIRVAKINPCGSLEARKLSGGGVMLYWRATLAGKSLREPIGAYDALASPKSLLPTDRGHSVPAAIRAAESLAQQHYTHRADGGYAALKTAAQAVKAAHVAALTEARKFTLENLLIDYCDHLEKLGRRSHKDARSIFKLHVFQPWPKVAALPANEVTPEQVSDMMRRTLELGRDRTANKLRSYVRAAYQLARAARSKASIPVHFKNYKVQSNPAADTSPDESANRPDKNPLSASELRAYWEIVEGQPGFRGAVLRLHLLTGGQRIEQLVNLKTADVQADRVTLLDGKGRPGKPPRPHVVPLTSKAAKALVECAPQGIYALSTNNGKTHIAATTLSNWAQAAVGEAIPDFQAKRIRSGVETLLASARISSEIRGRLQSHGISGVQARHYDDHDYLDEKREALEMFYRLLAAPSAGKKVVPIRGGVQ